MKSKYYLRGRKPYTVKEDTSTLYRVSKFNNNLAIWTGSPKLMVKPNLAG